MIFGLNKLGDILLEKNFIKPEQIYEALKYSRQSSVRFGESCMRLGFIDENQFAIGIAEQYGLEVMKPDETEVDQAVLRLIPVELLHKSRVVPVKRKGVSYIATSDPTNIMALDSIGRIIEEKGQTPGTVIVAPESAIERLLVQSSRFERMEETAENLRLEVLREAEEQEEVALEKITEGSSPAARLIDKIIYDAVSKRASDIHLESARDGLIVKYRIDGVLHRMVEPVEKRFQQVIISRLKVIGELDIAEKKIPQNGRFKLRLRDKNIDFRVSIIPALNGEDAVVRILDKGHITGDSNEFRLDLLGFNDDELAVFRRQVWEPYGMTLVTGPAGSGKTTTLYAALSEINSGEHKILTIEDPVEYELKGAVQVHVDDKKGITFASGLNSILRHDPDKIMVGEIRDPETAQLAVNTAISGHALFTTARANNIFDAIGRFIHMGVDPYNFASSLNCILSQRLIRIICDECKAPLKITEAELIEAGLDKKEYSGKTFYEGKGCRKCSNTGYRGRKAIIELLELDEEIREAIAANNISNLKRKVTESSMNSLRLKAIDNALNGKTTLKEVNRVTCG
ncbi:MAG: Flp pilus assembly complex ATPase component TadA [Deltaproteobacteria bacterium]|nr:Flp pilus assembly complex ATPase component TadA [Deltaproteobacteria bacterium]